MLKYCRLWRVNHMLQQFAKHMMPDRVDTSGNETWLEVRKDLVWMCRAEVQCCCSDDMKRLCNPRAMLTWDSWNPPWDVGSDTGLNYACFITTLWSMNKLARDFLCFSWNAAQKWEVKINSRFISMSELLHVWLPMLSLHDLSRQQANIWAGTYTFKSVLLNDLDVNLPWNF